MPNDPYAAIAQPKDDPYSAIAIPVPRHTNAVAKAAPKFGSTPVPAEKGFNALDWGTNMLPSIGAFAGAMLGAGPGSVVPGPGTMAGGAIGAAIGGAGGESLKQLLRRAAGYEVPESSLEAVEAIGTEGLKQGAYELGGQAVGRGIRAAMKHIPMPIPLTSSERTGGKFAGLVEHFTERSLPGAKVFQKFREKQNQAITDEIEGVINGLSRFNLTPEQRGMLTRRALDRARTKAKEDFDKAYKAIDQLTASHVERVPVTREITTSLVDEMGRPATYQKMGRKRQLVGGVQPETYPLRKAALTLLRDLKQQKQLLDPQLLGDTERMLTTIVSGPSRVPFQVMQKTRSDLLALSRKFDDVLPGKRAGIAKMLGKEADDAMMSAAERSGIEGLPEHIRAVNAEYASFHKRFDGDLIKKLMESNKPELVADYVKSAGLQEIRDLQSFIPKPQQRTIAAQVMRDVLDETLKAETAVPRGALDEFASRVLVPKVKSFSGDTFGKALDKIGDEKLRLLLGNAYPSVTKLRHLTARVGSGGGNIIAGLHNAMYLSTVAHPSLITAALPEAAFLNLAARLLTNPQAVDAIGQYIAATARHIPRAAEAAAITIRAIAQKEQPQRSEPLPLPEESQ